MEWLGSDEDADTRTYRTDDLAGSLSGVFLDAANG